MEISVNAQGLYTVFIDGQVLSNCSGQPLDFCPGGTICYTYASWQTHAVDGMCMCPTILGYLGTDCREPTSWSVTFITLDIVIAVASGLSLFAAAYIAFLYRRAGLFKCAQKRHSKEITLVCIALAEICQLAYAILKCLYQTLPVDVAHQGLVRGIAAKGNAMALFTAAIATGARACLCLLDMANTPTRRARAVDYMIGIIFLFYTFSNLTVALVIYGIADVSLRTSSKTAITIWYYKKFLIVYCAFCFSVFSVCAVCARTADSALPFCKMWCFLLPSWCSSGCNKRL